jgi:hypothetical protein
LSWLILSGVDVVRQGNNRPGRAAERHAAGARLSGVASVFGHKFKERSRITAAPADGCYRPSRTVVDVRLNGGAAAEKIYAKRTRHSRCAC